MVANLSGWMPPPIYDGAYEVFVPKEYFEAIRSVQTRKATKRPYGTYSLLLKCGIQDCGCTVIYDPKVKTIKSTGEKKEYRYYHCCDAKFYHREYKIKQVNVTEKHITEQFGHIFHEIHFNDDLANLVSKALKESHHQTIKLHKQKLSSYKAKLKELEYKEDRIYDDHLKGLLDESSYKRQFERIRKERDNYTSLLGESDELISDTFFATVDHLLELAKCSKLLWKNSSPEKRIDLIKEVTSNQELEGISVRYDLKKPFQTLKKIKNLSHFNKWCPGPDLNWHEQKSSQDFKSCASTNSATGAYATSLWVISLYSF